jgi:hypothetical protein
LQPLLIEWLDKAVNETHKLKLIAALPRRQTKSSKYFLDRYKTAWYGLLRKLSTKYTAEPEKAAHDDTLKDRIKCIFICGMPNDIRMAIESIAGNTYLLETALAAAVQYESAMNSGAQKQGGAKRYGAAALEIMGSLAASAPQSAPGAAGMQDMKHELAAILSALAALGVQKKAGNQNRQGAPRQEDLESQHQPARQAGQAQDASLLRR